MRKIIATTVLTATALVGIGMGAPAAEAAKVKTRTITFVDECEYEDGSGPADSRPGYGCGFYGGNRRQGDLLVLNYDGGTRWTVVKTNKNGRLPIVSEKTPVRLTIDPKTRKVISVRQGGIGWKTTDAKVWRR